MNDIKVTFTIVTLKHEPQIDISGSYENVLKIYIQVLLAFGAKCDVDESGIMKCQGERFQKYSQNIKENLSHLMVLSSNNAIGQLYNIFKQMDFGDPFAFFPQPLTVDEISVVREEMIKRYLGPQYENYKSYYDNIWKNITNNYNITHYENGHNTISSIGEKGKSKRICRFCGLKIPETTFNNKSHSISEALGNKNIITNDECDACNAFFGKNIEIDLINCLDFFRLFYGIQGKGGKKKFASKDFEITKDNIQNELLLKIQEENIALEDKNKIKIQLKHPQKINWQNVYRTLVKYALSVCNESYLQNFKETIKWIKSDFSCKELSWVTILATNKTSKSFPEISVFFRKNENTELPYSFMVLEINGLTFIALIPLSSKDNCNFNSELDFNRFWELLKPYNQNPILKRFKPLADEAKEFTYDISFEQRNEHKNNNA